MAMAQVFLALLQLPPVSIIVLTVHNHSFTYVGKNTKTIANVRRKRPLLGGLNKSTKPVCQNSRYSGQDLNHGSPKYERLKSFLLNRDYFKFRK